jgi:hypothetical protein
MPALSQKLLAGEIQSVTSDSLVAMKWCDKQDVRMLSILHSDEIMNTRKLEGKRTYCEAEMYCGMQL